MIKHTQAFKNQIKSLGRELDVKIVEDNGTVLDSEAVNSVTLSYDGSLLKSVMKMLVIDSNVPLKKGDFLYYKLGVKVNGTYEYLDYAYFIVEKVEKQEDMGSYKITCYDLMLLAMKDYEPLELAYPCTLGDFFRALCTRITLGPASLVFPNSDRIIAKDVYEGIGYTYRDALDDIAQATGSTICVNYNDDIEMRYITDTNDTIDEEFLKDVNVNFGKKYGPINSIVLSRAGGSDNVYLQDPASVQANGLHELKIVDNQLMNFNDRDEYLPAILDKLNGTEYYLNDFTSTGVCYYELCDRYNVKIGDKTYSCVMFNDEIQVTQGLVENIHTDEPETSETEYKYADKTDRRINQVSLIVDKQNQRIDALASKVVDLSKFAKGVGSVILENASEGQLYKLVVRGALQDFPSKNLFPSSTLFPKSSNLVVEHEGESIKYPLPHLELRYYQGVYDEMVIEDSHAIKVKRLEYHENNGTITILPKPIEEPLGDVNIVLGEGTNKLYLESFPNAQLDATYLLKNDYTDVFSSKAELNAKLTIQADQINSEVSKKVDSGEVISTINQSAEQITLKGNRVVIESNNFNLTGDGTATMKNAVIDGGDINLKNGAKITGDNGLITNLIYPGFTRGNIINGTGDYIPLGHSGGGDTVETQNNALVFNFKLPNNFTVKSAKVYLTHAPITWKYEGKTTTGYSRNLNLYKVLSTDLEVDMETFYAPHSSSYELIPNAFGSGFTGSAYGLSSAESIDIKEFISNAENNQLAVMTSDGVLLGNDAIFSQTGGVVGYLEVIGFTNFDK